MQAESTSTPVLSISLLSSGRKETIWKCLDSLKPIREAVESELIIVDTGCDEETHQRMLDYTDQIIRFIWCNDFSKARNAGLKLARGEWFLFIDDDEWFTDVQELIDFFLTGEYREYGCANYIQRNYTNKSGKTYQDSWVSRVIRLDKDTRFVSSIHEYLYPVKGKCKLLHCPVDHYGYVFKDDQEKYAHSRRNVSLLLDMRKKEPDNLRWWVQLAQEYLGIKELQKLEELCEEGEKRFRKQDEAGVNRQRGTFYVGLVMVEMHRKNYERAEERYLSAIQDQRNTQACQASLYSYGADIYYKLKKDKECEDCCRKYLKIYDELSGDEMQIMWQTSFFVRDVFEKERRNNIYGFFIASALHRGDTSILKEYFYKFGWEEKHIRLYAATPKDIVEGMASLPYEEEFADMAYTMMRRKGVDDKVVQAIKRIEAESKEREDSIVEKEEEIQPEKRVEKFMHLCRIFSQIETPNNYYIWYMKLRYADYRDDRYDMEKIYGMLLSRVINLWDLDNSVFAIALKYNINIEHIFLSIRFENWKKGVDFLYEKGNVEKIDLGKRVIDELCSAENIRFSYFYMKYSENLLLREKEEASYRELRGRLQVFCQRHLNFYRQFYKDSAFTGEMEILTPVCRLAVRLEQVLKEEAEESVSGMKEALKLCFKIYAPMDKKLQLFAKLYAENQKEKYEERSQAQTEMKKIAEQIKIRVEQLLYQQMYAEAYVVWQQLSILMPEDKEILFLGERIRTGLS